MGSLAYILVWCGMIIVVLATLLFRNSEPVRIAGMSYCVISIIGIAFYFIKTSAYLRNIIAKNSHAMDKLFITIDQEPQLLTFENNLLERAVDDGVLDEYEEVKDPNTINRDTQPALAQALRIQQLKDELADDSSSRWVHTIGDHYEEECGICFEKITTMSLCCPECNKAAHPNCVRKWIRSGNKTCVYCRATLIM